MLLYIDTTDFKAMRFAVINEKATEKTFEIAYNENWKTLEHLENFLKLQKVKVQDIKKIVVCSGPGSFTGTRVGVTIAEALAFANKIPLVAISKDKLPKDLRKLLTLKSTKKIEIEYLPSKYDK